MKLHKFSAVLAMILVTGASVPALAGYVIGYGETRSIFAGRTMMSYDGQHGTQVEYDGPNGATYLLYPGNNVIVRGNWKLTRTSKPTVFNICFRYPSNSYNPATHQAGGSWECQIAGFYLGSRVQMMPGDVLGLSRSRQVPFVLSPGRTTLASLIRKLGGR